MTMADETGVPTPEATPSPAPEAPPMQPEAPAPAEQPEGASAPGAEPGSSAPDEPEQERETLVDAIADLLQMFVNWLRAEASDIMRDKVVLPLQQLGLTLASASAAGCLLVIGLSFLFVALLLVLAAWLGWPGALTLVGTVIIIGAGIFTFVKMRSLQK